MYGYNEYISLSPEEILNEVTQEEIFGIFIKEPIITDKDKATYVAPYRDDREPSCYFEEYDGRLFFVDFADTPPSNNCFLFIKKCTGLSTYSLVYDYIVKKLGLKGTTISKETQEVAKESVELKTIKKQRTIKFLPRPFNKQDKEFWSKYGISSNSLKTDGVIPIQMYQSISRKGVPFTIVSKDIMYAYTGFNEGRIKIYRPYGDENSKWFTNCTQNDIGAINTLPQEGELLIITKSYKDCAVLRNQDIDTVWFQNEGQIPSPTILRNLCKRFKKVLVWFDNDSTGIKAAKLVVSHINALLPGKARAIHLDVKLLEENIKDPSDLEAKKGKKELTKFLKEKSIINK